MPLDEGLDTDLRFLLLEVTRQAKASRSSLLNPEKDKSLTLITRDHYVDRLRDTIENKGYFHIFNINPQQTRQAAGLRAIISIASHLESMGGHFVKIAKQSKRLKDSQWLSELDAEPFFDVILKTLAMIYEAFRDTNPKVARQICKAEEEISQLYLVSFNNIMERLREGVDPDDQITLLFIIRYLERVGDDFLSIGTAILNIKVGENLPIHSHRSLRKGLKLLGIDLHGETMAFHPILNTRSGCRIARIKSEQKEIFYKEGPIEKMTQEIKGIQLWQKSFPGHIPLLLWKTRKSEHITLLQEWIRGKDLLDISVADPEKSPFHQDQALESLFKTLSIVWGQTIRRKKKTEVDFLKQLSRRRNAIKEVHKALIDSKSEFSSLLRKVKKIEKGLKVPFHVLCHGDFNIDNVIFEFNTYRPVFVDVHRSNFRDYVQDVSVFLVSNYRVPIFSHDVRSRLNHASLGMLHFARNFSKEHQDRTFELRLALGLIRSFTTSTRFELSKDFSSNMFDRALIIMQSLVSQRKNLDSFKIQDDWVVFEKDLS